VELGAPLSSASFERIVTSPLRRAVESAQIVAETTGLPLAPADPELIERDYGVAEGLPVAEAHERWPEGGYPGAEPLDRLGERARDALRRIAALPGDSIVVSHGAFLRAGVVALTGTPHPRIENGEVVWVEVDGASRAAARARGPRS
jgi:uncharacterized phosphatase